jgi:hypothetical protein
MSFDSFGLSPSSGVFLLCASQTLSSCDENSAGPQNCAPQWEGVNQGATIAAQGAEIFARLV